MSIETQFSELLSKQCYKEAIDLFKTVDETQQIALIAQLCEKTKPSPLTFDMQGLKTISLLCRKLKSAHTYTDFYNAWLPPGSTPHTPDILKNYFGFHSFGCVLQAINLNQPDEITSIGLMSADKAEVFNVIKQHAHTEYQRHENIAKVSDKVGETKLLEIIDIVT
jgi:hypothetical protein